LFEFDEITDIYLDKLLNRDSVMSVNVTVVDRDLFYELIRDWQECHMTPGWNMVETQGEKIRHLVGYRTELANHIHFARLFQSQLIQVRHRDCGLVIETVD